MQHVFIRIFLMICMTGSFLRGMDEHKKDFNKESIGHNRVVSFIKEHPYQVIGGAVVTGGIIGLYCYYKPKISLPTVKDAVPQIDSSEAMRQFNLRLQLLEQGNKTSLIKSGVKLVISPFASTIKTTIMFGALIAGFLLKKKYDAAYESRKNNEEHAEIYEKTFTSMQQTHDQVQVSISRNKKDYDDLVVISKNIYGFNFAIEEIFNAILDHGQRVKNIATRSGKTQEGIMSIPINTLVTNLKKLEKKQQEYAEAINAFLERQNEIGQEEMQLIALSQEVGNELEKALQAVQHTNNPTIQQKGGSAASINDECD